jgi:hypothetical protein
MHGEVLRWRGGLAMRALLSIAPQILQFRAQTGDRQEKIGGKKGGNNRPNRPNRPTLP